MGDKELNGRAIAADMLTAIAAEVQKLKASGWGPKLVSIKIGDNRPLDPGIV